MPLQQSLVKAIIRKVLKIEKVKTYWDKDSTLVRSLGFYNKSGYGSVGERTGLWRFWTKKGIIEETVFYWMGLSTEERSSFIQMENYLLKDIII